MSCRKLKRTGLSSNILEKLIRHNISTCKDLLSCSQLEVVKILSSGPATADEVFTKCSQSCSPRPITAYDLWKNRCEANDGFFATSLKDLDVVLHGGLPKGTISEIAGPSGCGKTQFSIMLSLLVTMPKSHGGLDGSVMYIDTEGAFSAERLVEMATNKFPDYFHDNSTTMSELTDRVHVNVIQTCNQLLERLKNLEEDIISKKIKLIVIDSIASLVRKEFSTTLGRNLTDRTNLLVQEAAILKYLAEVFSIPIVVTNQITTRFGNDNIQDEQTSSSGLEDESGYVTAALGNTWSHSVNTRLLLQYLTPVTRQVMVAKSPVAPFTTFTYTIESAGIIQQDGGAGHYEGTDPGKQQIKVRSALPFQVSQSSSLLS
ncbi:hypothetical protein SNE40_008789 [Patella caerulea]|uniref:DNA repair protein RAD51 homolog 2 n=1 Tax=Patella caerulea TaxID=87958 RepID=A0AAN8JVB0_PATCE